MSTNFRKAIPLTKAIRVTVSKNGLASTSLMSHSLASPSSVSNVLYQKYVNDMSLYRQEKEWEQLGIFHEAFPQKKVKGTLQTTVEIGRDYASILFNIEDSLKELSPQERYLKRPELENWLFCDTLEGTVHQLQYIA